MATTVVNKTVTKLNSPVETKDVREFEHGRQKAKKTSRTQSWRDEKAHRRRVKTGEHVLPPPPHTMTAKRGRSGHQMPRVDDPMWDIIRAEDDSNEDMFLQRIMWDVIAEEEQEGKVMRSKTTRVEIDLVDIMKPARPRRTKRGMSLLHTTPK